MWDNTFVFFFQAEDGIRDVAVTGVQTCALPILRRECARGEPANSRDWVAHGHGCLAKRRRPASLWPGNSAASAWRGDWAAPRVGGDAPVARGVGGCIAQRSVDVCRNCIGSDDCGCAGLRRARAASDESRSDGGAEIREKFGLAEPQSGTEVGIPVDGTSGSLSRDVFHLPLFAVCFPGLPPRLLSENAFPPLDTQGT